MIYLAKLSSIAYYVRTRRRRKVESQHADKLLSRIEIVREGLSSNPSDGELKKAICPLFKDVRRLVFDVDGKKFLRLNECKVFLIVAFCQSLVEINKYSLFKDRELTFSSQRWLFQLAIYLFSHPEYDSWFEHQFGSGKEQKLVLTQAIFELAERQNFSPTFYADLAAEGEWVKQVLDITSYKVLSISPSPKGLNAVLELWQNICLMATKHRPERIEKLFINLKESATSILHADAGPPYIYPDTHWFPEWREKYAKLTPSVGSIQEYEKAYSAFIGEEEVGEGGDEWSHIREEACKNKAEPISPWELEDLQRACIQHSALASIYWLFALVAQSGLWCELRKCWYASQPLDSNANYCEHDLFSRDPTAFITWVLDNSGGWHINLYERHDLDSNAARACIVILAELINTNENYQLSISTSDVKETEMAIRLVSLLRHQIPLIKDPDVGEAFKWDQACADDLFDSCESQLESQKGVLEDRLKQLLANCVPNPANNPKDKVLLFDAWRETQKNFWNTFGSSEWANISFVKKLPPEMVTASVDSFESYYLSSKSTKVVHGLQFQGGWVAGELRRQVLIKLMNSAKGTLGAKPSGSYWILPNSSTEYYRREREEIFDRWQIQVPEDDPICRLGIDRMIIIEPGAIELQIYEWHNMPWHHVGDKPTVVFGFTDFSEKIHVGLSLYYDLKINDPNGITVLDLTECNQL